MREVADHAKRGGPVLAICNGFQVACEAGLLPGALLRNASLKFISQPVNLRVENTDTMFTSEYQPGQILRIPVAHGEGRYVADAATIQTLEDSGRVVFRYCAPTGELSLETNINGSINNIAGIINDQGNVLRMMPHPERAAETLIGSEDGLGIFASLLARVGV
jgi:phosphoribosylformylglycinamidine synthase